MATKIELNKDTQGGVRRAIFLNFFFVGLCFSSWASRIPEIKSFFNMDDAEWGFMLLMVPVGQLIGMSFSGRLISAIGSDRVLYAAVVGYALSLFGLGATTTEGGFIASLVSFGFFGNFCNISMNTQAVVVENYYNRPIMASFHGGWSLAGLCGGLVGLMMTVSGVSIPMHFIAIALVAIIGSLTQCRYLQSDASPKGMSADAATKESPKVKAESFLYLLGIIGFIAWLTEGAVADWSGIYMGEVVGLSERVTPIGFTAYMIAMTIGRFLMDRATALWGRRTILCACSAAIFIGMAIMTLLPMPIPSILGIMIVGFGACGMIPALYSTAGEKSRLHTGRSITIVSTISFAGFLIGPPAIGYLSQATNLRYGLSIVTIFGVISWIMSSRIKILRK